MPNDLPCPEMLRKVLRYEPETGDLFWRTRPLDMFQDGVQSALHSCRRYNSTYANKQAFRNKCHNGYYRGLALGRQMLAHRAIWAIFYGRWPACQIDHINGNPSDNRIHNLREVSHAENSRNMSLKKTNTSGHQGVSWCDTRKNWRAYVNINGKYKYIGRFDCKDAAVKASKDARRKLGYHPNHGRPSRR